MGEQYTMEHFGSVEFLLEVSKGNVPGHSCIQKFGRNFDIDTGTDPEDCWSQGGTYAFLSSAQTLYASSSDADGDQDIVIEGLDANWDEQSQTVTLNGQIQVAIAGTWIRVFRAYNDDSTEIAGDVYIAETDTLTGGVPDTATKIKVKIDVGKDQTLMAIYSIPAAKTGYILGWHSSIEGATPVGLRAALSLRVREFGKIFRVQHTHSLYTEGNSYIQHLFKAIPKYPAKSDIMVFIDKVTANNADVAAGFDIILVDD